MTTLPSRQGFHRGFTLLELLMVIGIIVILVGILFPVVAKVRKAALVADTSQEISQLSNAIMQYYADFHAYPGPFSNDAIENEATTPIQLYLYSNGAWSGSVQQFNVTGSENLALGLLGGLNINPAGTGGNTIGFNPAEVGLGPLSLNTATPRRYTPYVQSSSGSNGLLMWCGTVGGQETRTTQYSNTETLTTFQDGANHPANDSIIPEFVDRFPAPGPMPILYLRARVGAQGIVSDAATKDINGNSVVYQYDLRDILGYTAANPTTGISIGIRPPVAPASTTTHNLIPNAAPVPSSPADITFIDQSDIVAAAGVLGPPIPGVTSAKPDAGAYFKNPTVPPTDISSDVKANYTGRPRAVDEFILISAGPDGIYGTTDDITSFGDITP